MIVKQFVGWLGAETKVTCVGVEMKREPADEFSNTELQQQQQQRAFNSGVTTYREGHHQLTGHSNTLSVCSNASSTVSSRLPVTTFSGCPRPAIKSFEDNV